MSQERAMGSIPADMPSSVGDVATLDCLEGVRVVELGQFLSAPYGGMILADLGAEVIKVEPPGRGDEGRRMGMPYDGGDALIFRDLNRGKRSVTIDFKTPDGRAALLALVASADVVISNLRAGIVEAHGIDGPCLTALNPQLVYCDLAAFGHVGPMRPLPGYEPLAQAFSGLASVNGHPDGPPTRTGPSVVDLGSGMWIALSAMAALRRRDRSGRGGVIRLSLVETALGWIAPDISGLLNEGRVPTRRGNGQPLLAPYDVFQASDGPIAIAVGNDSQFQRLAALLGHPGWSDPERFGTNARRLAGKPELVELVTACLKARSRAHWSTLFEREGVPSSPVNTIPEALATEQVMAVGMVRTSPATGRQTVGLPFTLDDRRPGSLEASPTLGEHNADYLVGKRST